MRAPDAPRLPIVAFAQQGRNPLVIGRDKINGFKPALVTHREGENLWFHKVKRRKVGEEKVEEGEETT